MVERAFQPFAALTTPERIFRILCSRKTMWVSQITRVPTDKPKMRAVLALSVTTISCLTAGSAVAAATGAHSPSVSVFIAQIAALLLCGRLLGEMMQRIGQPAVLGQLIAGILLGP